MSNPRPLREKTLTMPEVRNPFVHSLHFTWLDKLQIAVMTVTLFPIRIALIFFFLVCGWALASIALMGRPKEERREPLTGWRNWLRPMIVVFSRGVFFFGGFHWITIKGEMASAEEAPILAVAPHSTFFDALSITFLDLTSVVAKSAAESIPFFGTLTQYTQPVFVSREDPNSRQNTIQEIKRRAQSKGAWPQIVIFPEGTCTNRKTLISFKPGAFYPGVPVQPVCLKYKNNRLDTVTWTWEGPDAFKCLWYTLCQFHTNLEIEFLPVYTPSEDEKNDAKLFGRNVRDVMAKAMGVQVSDHTYEDTRIMNYASKLDLPAATGLVDFAKLSQKLGLKFDKKNMQETLNKYVGIAQQNKGIVTLEEFAKYMDVPMSETLTELFEMYDRDGSNTIDFREFVIGLSLCGMPANNEDTIKLAFKVYDGGDRGSIVETEFRDILKIAFDMHIMDIHSLFRKVDEDKDGKITYDQFKSYAVDRPEFSRLFWTFQQLEEAAQQLSLTKLLMNGNTADTDNKAKAE